MLHRVHGSQVRQQQSCLSECGTCSACLADKRSTSERNVSLPLVFLQGRLCFAELLGVGQPLSLPCSRLLSIAAVSYCRDDCSAELLEWGSRVSAANSRPPLGS